MKYPKVSNKYTFKCYNKSGELTQQVTAHNIVLNNYYMYDSAGYLYLGLALGSGITAPLTSDTKLTTWLFNAEACVKYSSEKLSDTHIKVSSTFTVPADASHVGTVSEFGLWAAASAGTNTTNPTLLTKGLLKDSEGQTITIEKTDLDRLTVDTELHIQLDESDGFFWLTTPNSSLMNLPGLWQRPDSNKLVFTAAKRHKKYDMCYERDYSSVSVATRHTITTAVTRDTANLIYKFGQSRLPATSTLNGHYVQGVGLLRLRYSCAWYFPSAQFPTKTINNIVVGVGDGSTTEFEPPIALWLENTDRVYVAGVLQTRGVDYTIEHNANRQRLPEVTPGAVLDDYTKDGDYSNVDSSTLTSYKPIPFSAYVDTGVVLVQDSHVTVKLATDGTIGDKVNYWVPGTFTFYEPNSQQSLPNQHPILSLLSSEDGEVFTLRDSYTYDNSTCDTPRSFTLTTDKYWRLTCDFSETSRPTGTLGKSTTNTSSILGYYGEPIKFTAPPADGAKITMSLQLDRPYKNENFVMDMYPEFHFGGA